MISFPQKMPYMKRGHYRHVHWLLHTEAVLYTWRTHPLKVIRRTEQLVDHWLVSNTCASATEIWSMDCTLNCWTEVQHTVSVQRIKVYETLNLTTTFGTYLSFLNLYHSGVLLKHLDHAHITNNGIAVGAELHLHQTLAITALLKNHLWMIWSIIGLCD